MVGQNLEYLNRGQEAAEIYMQAELVTAGGGREFFFFVGCFPASCSACFFWGGMKLVKGCFVAETPEK